MTQIINKNKQTKKKQNAKGFAKKQLFIIRTYKFTIKQTKWTSTIYRGRFLQQATVSNDLGIVYLKSEFVVLSFTLRDCRNEINHLDLPALSLSSSTRSPIFTSFPLKRSYLPACSSFDKRLSPNRSHCTNAHSAQIPYVNPLCDKPDERKINEPATVIRSQLSTKTPPRR